MFPRSSLLPVSINTGSIQPSEVCPRYNSAFFLILNFFYYCAVTQGTDTSGTRRSPGDLSATGNLPSETGHSLSIV